MSEMMKEEVVVFEDGELQLEVKVEPEGETVWLTQEQISKLFGKAKSTINEHINNIYKEGELAENDTMTKFGNSEFSDKPTNYYNLDMIISVGYRVKSQRGIQFRKWATSVLKEYMIRGVAINEKRIQHLEKTVEITSSMIAGALNIDTQDVLYVVKQYTSALELLA